MTALKTSIIRGLFVRLYAVFVSLWSESVTGKIFARIRAGIKGSVILAFLGREGAMDKSWEQSRSYKVWDFIVNLIPNVFKAVYKAGGRLFSESLILSGLGFLGDKLYILLGLFFAVMIVAPHGVWNNAYAFIGMMLMLFLFAFLSARSGKKLRADKTGPFLPIFLAVAAYSFISSIDVSQSVRFMLFYVTAALTVILVVSSADTEKRLTILITAVLAAVTIAGLYGCYQRVIGVEVVENQVDLTLDLNKDMPGRVYSSFDNPNNFAELLVLTIPFFIAMFLNAKTGKGKLLSIIGVLPAILAIGMTYSRSSWIGLVLAILVFVAFKNWRVLPIVIILGLLAIPILPQSILNRILTIGNLKDSSTSYRFLIFALFFDMLRDVWVKGIGLGSDVVFIAVESYKQLVNGHYPVHAHNNYIQIVAEMGVLGLISYLALIFNTLKRGIKSAAGRYLPKTMKNFVIAGISSMVGILVIGIVEYTWFYPRVMFVFWLVFAFTVAAFRMGNNIEAKPERAL